jgi:hypothetical protein
MQFSIYAVNPGGLFDAGLQDCADVDFLKWTVVYEAVDRHGMQEGFEAEGSAITPPIH